MSFKPECESALLPCTSGACELLCSGVMAARQHSIAPHFLRLFVCMQASLSYPPATWPKGCPMPKPCGCCLLSGGSLSLHACLLPLEQSLCTHRPCMDIKCLHGHQPSRILKAEINQWGICRLERQWRTRQGGPRRASIARGSSCWTMPSEPLLVSKTWSAPSVSWQVMRPVLGALKA